MKASRAVVTGSTGIAASCARQLAAEGSLVFLISLEADSCLQLAEELGEAAAGWFAGDLRDELIAEEGFAAAAEALGHFDAVLATAGGSARLLGDGWIHEMTLDAWNASIGLNLSTTFLTAREAIRHMQARGGSLVMTSSVLASAPQPENFASHGYAAAKAAINGLTIALASAYGRDGIRVNSVAPGLVSTPMANRAAQDPTIVAFARRKQPVSQGMLAADDVAAALCWLAGSAGVTGQNFAVDGGWSVTSTS